MTCKVVCLRYAEAMTKLREEDAGLTGEINELKEQAVALRLENSRLKDVERVYLESHKDMSKELEVLKDTHAQLKRVHSKTTKAIHSRESKIEALQASLKEVIKDYRDSYEHQRELISYFWKGYEHTVAQARLLYPHVNLGNLPLPDYVVEFSSKFRDQLNLGGDLGPSGLEGDDEEESPCGEEEGGDEEEADEEDGGCDEEGDDDSGQ